MLKYIRFLWERIDRWLFEKAMHRRLEIEQKIKKIKEELFNIRRVRRKRDLRGRERLAANIMSSEYGRELKSLNWQLSWCNWQIKKFNNSLK